DWDGLLAHTSATSTTYNIETDGVYTFKVSVMDEAGNITTKEITVERFDMPVVINEIAWMGTQSNTAHEWIELYNRSDKNINLASFVIKKTRNTFTIHLSGEISANSYYLLERGTDDAIKDISAGLIYESTSISDLHNQGDQLILERNGSVIDETPPRGAEGCGNTKWCAGSGGNISIPAYSMERVDPDVAGRVPSNWGSAVGEFIQNGISENGQIIKGTPRSDNSTRHLINTTDILYANKTLTTKNSPYIITRSGFTVEKDIVLTLEKGVVIKIITPNEPSLYVKGKIVANGNTSEPVVITSYFDDEYGGDLDGLICNEDSSENCPNSGDWKQIFVYDTGELEFENTIIKYGGRYFANTSMKSMIAVDKANIDFENVTISDSLDSGLYMKNGSLVWSGGEVKNTNSVAGLLFAGTGDAEISNIIFTNNLLDISIEGTGYDFSCLSCALDLKTKPPDLIKLDE
ncbi:MAG: lamin tail domain-containing protein, partial [Patescibacteria group bacterium]